MGIIDPVAPSILISPALFRQDSLKGLLEMDDGLRHSFKICSREIFRSGNVNMSAAVLIAADEAVFTEEFPRRPNIFPPLRVRESSQ